MPIYDFSSEENAPSQADFLAAAEDIRTEIEQTESQISVYDINSPEILNARTNADEQINTSGAPVIIHPRADNAGFDPIWDEDPDPTYLNPINLKGFFKPQSLKIELKKWGVNTLADTEVVFSHRLLFEQLGERMLRSGDVIRLPYNAAQISPTSYEVTNGAPTGQFRYVWLYFTCQVTVLKADTTIRVKDDMQFRPEAEGGDVGFSESY